MRGIKNIPFYFLFLALAACNEPFPIETIDFEDILVVETTITNEMKRQVVKLSRTITLESFEPSVVANAEVKIESSTGSIFNFSWDDETENYISNVAFQAMADVTYTLKIKEQNGHTFASTSEMLTESIEIGSVYPETSTEGIEGVQVYVDTYEATDSAKYFRYEFEETYMIKAPNPSDLDWEIIDYDFLTGTFDIILTDKVPETICYASKSYTGILQTSTSELNENKVLRFPLHFIYRENSVLRERYSILVKQYVQTLEAYTFYNTLKELGSAESLLSEGQPGFVTGNISSENSDERVMGFFEVSSVTLKRIYFNYKDFVFEFPPYFFECEKLELFPGELLKRKLEEDKFQIVDYVQFGPLKQYRIYSERCTDCTSFASKKKPDFWED